jgi:hypothetical protein
MYVKRLSALKVMPEKTNSDKVGQKYIIIKDASSE